MAQTVSSPLVVTSDGAVVENLVINATGSTHGIVVDGADNVVIRNVTIYHEGGMGIYALSAPNIRLENVVVINTAAPDYGPHTGSNASDRNNIEIQNSPGAIVVGAYVEKGSSGILVVDSDNVWLGDIEGFDIRGPFPRGQFVQFVRSDNAVLDTFSVINPGDTSWTEDVVSAYSSNNPTIRNGYIEGSNSPSGNGVMIENPEGGSGGLVENVDVRYYVNGAFSAGTLSSGVTFRNVRALDGIAAESVSDSDGLIGSDGRPIPTLEEWAGHNYRGLPSSGQEPFHAFGALLSNIVFEDAYYYNLPRTGRIAYDLALILTEDFIQRAGQVNHPLDLKFSWGNAHELISSTSLNLGYYPSATDGFLTGSANVNLTGNANANRLIGNSGNNVITGGAGHDYLDGDSGSDVLNGGAGNDTYYVGRDNPRIVEASGNDTVISSISRSLTSYSGIENLRLVGNAVTAIGNSGNNTLVGNGYDNVLRGGSGADKLYGGAGNDTYDLGGDTSDFIQDSSGTDTITGGISRSLASYSGIERLFLTGTENISAAGNSLNNNLKGNAGNNRMTGGAGNDALEGGRGLDTMTGGSGNDHFVYRTAADSVAGGNRDVITDFGDSGADRIDLSDVSSATLRFVGGAAFTGANQVKVTAIGSDVYVHVNLDSNTNTTEMQIKLAGTALSAINAADFIL